MPSILTPPQYNATTQLSPSLNNDDFLQTFLGQKYGYRPFPPKIPSKEFQKLFKAVANNEDRDLLQRWFKEDKNSVPSQYLLQPITHVLPDYRNYEQPELRKQASSMWWTAFERMQVIFRNAAAKVLNKKEQLKYFMSGN